MSQSRHKARTSDRTRDRVLQVAAELFAEKGYGSTSMRDVARAAGIRVSTLYHHCRSKDELWREITGETQRQIRAIIGEAMSGVPGGDLRKLVRTAIDRLFDFYLSNRHLARLSFRAALGDRLEEVDHGATRWVGFMEGVVSQPRARQALNDLEPGLLLITLEGLVTYHLVARDSYLGLFGKDVDSPEMARRAKDHVTAVITRILGLDLEDSHDIAPIR